jgi:hypothetical protein
MINTHSTSCVTAPDGHHSPRLTAPRRRPLEFWRRTCWVYCWHCQMHWGPYDPGTAFYVALDIDRGVGM